jgi:FSR family fosmidomycin resistance protein-like MFS transporter
MSDPTSESLEHDDSRAVALFSNAAHTCTHMFTILYATAVLHLPSVFGMPFGEMLRLSSVGLVLYGVCALPAGWLADRYSQVGMIVLFFFGIGAGALVTGLAESSTGLFVGLTLIGGFAAIYHPVGIAWLIASAKKQGMTLGVNGVFGGVGSALAPVFVGVMIDYVHWRAAFLAPGATAIVLGVALAIAWRRGIVSDSVRDRAPSAAPEPGAMIRVFLILTVTMCASGFVYTGLITTMPKLFEMGLDKASAISYTEIGFYVGMVIGLASFSSLLGGWLADRYPARGIYIVFWLLTVPPVILMITSTGITLMGMALLAMLFTTAFSAAENMLVARYTPFKWRSIAYGAKFVLALGVGGLTVSLAGELFDRGGSFEALYLMFAGAGLAASAVAVLLPRTKTRSEVSETG